MRQVLTAHLQNNMYTATVSLQCVVLDSCVGSRGPISLPDLLESTTQTGRQGRERERDSQQKSSLVLVQAQYFKENIVERKKRRPEAFHRKASKLLRAIPEQQGKHPQLATLHSRISTKTIEAEMTFSGSHGVFMFLPFKMLN